MTETKPQERGDLFKLIFDHSPFGIYTLNSDGYIDSFNPKMVEMAGSKDANEVLGLSVFDMNSYKNSGLDSLFRVGLRGTSFDTEVKYLSHTGKKESWRHYQGIPMRSSDQIITGLLLIVEDVTERNLLQDKLNQYTTSLEEEVKKRTGDLVSLEKQYEVMVEKSLVGISILQGGVFQYVNPKFLSIFGYESKEEVIGKGWEITVPEEEFERIRAEGIKDRMSGAGVARVYTTKGRKKDGSIIYLEISSSPALYQGKPAAVGSLQDITERVKVDEKEKKHLAEVERMNKLMIDRELKMAELKRLNEELKKASETKEAE